MNLLEEMEDLPPEGTQAVVEAWHRFIDATWSTWARDKKSLEAPAIAQALAQELPEHARALFLDGCGVTSRSQARALAALERSRDRFAWMELGPWLAQLQCPVHLVHGTEDDVIPCNQLGRLAQAMPPHHPVFCWRTGLYGHSAAQDRSPAQAVRAALSEVTTLLGMLRGLASGAQA
jgi:pimeloyl-ACP methyl ester carboxylesterase